MCVGMNGYLKWILLFALARGSVAGIKDSSEIAENEESSEKTGKLYCNTKF